MVTQTLGSSAKLFYSSRLKGLILFSLFIEDVLNCIFFRTEGIFSFFLAAITEYSVVTSLCSEMFFGEGCCLSVDPPQGTQVSSYMA